VTCDQARRSASATPHCGQLIPALQQASPIAVMCSLEPSVYIEAVYDWALV